MRLPVVPRAELEVVRAEREEWRRRAEATSRAPEAGPRSRRIRALVLAPFAGCVLMVGIALGVAIVPGSSGGVARPDYPGCIGRARYEAPIAGNQYQELVNALYACGVYAKASPAGG